MSRFMPAPNPRFSSPASTSASGTCSAIAAAVPSRDALSWTRIRIDTSGVFSTNRRSASTVRSRVSYVTTPTSTSAATAPSVDEVPKAPLGAAGEPVDENPRRPRARQGAGDTRSPAAIAMLRDPVLSGPMAATTGFVLSGERHPIRELVAATWRSRSLISILARKDFFVRYRRATFGMIWAAALPLMQAMVLAFIVSRFVKFDTNGGAIGGSYVAFVLSGTVPWQCFAGMLNGGSTSIVDGANLSAKIYFPRIVLPLANGLTAAYGLVLSIVAVFAVSLITGVDLGPDVLYIVPGILLGLWLGASFAVVLSALHVYFRDVRYLVQAALLVWVYLTPVIYPLSFIGDARKFIMVNPMTGVVELYRAATVGAEAGWEWAVLWSVCWCVVLTIFGLFLHRRFDRVFVDLL